ncbi:Heat shock 70 kDa protein 17 [Acorus calamus]|uniref:Heat shock 70 kDa protein 17 n=1 Tax=Acorus calamus TaxID=4465 RepID=A0AAV9FHN1_ACOCL|nr:Heat shock 70 kDa protein 17 [Acorus calamus]
MLPLILSFAIILSSVVPTEPAVWTVDLGSEWTKVAVVNLRPGQTPISVAINEMSKRKSPSLVAFHGGTRLVAEEAAGIVARYPDKVYSHVRDFLAKPASHVRDLLRPMYLPFDVVEDHRGVAAIRIDDGVTVYTVEELVAMVLRYGLSLAESHVKGPVKDAVVTVPPWFGQAERRGLLQAAQLAGINVLALINEHAGAALQYGIDKDFSNGSRNVVFYDMGASSTYAALVYFSAYNTKEFGKTVSVNQFQVKDVRWNTGLGGQTMELRLVEYFADEFNKQVGNGFDVRKSTVTREKFEELCGDLWEQSLVPLKEVIQNSGLKTDDIYAVELIGGATRVPKIQAKLMEFLGRKDLDKHLDADEAIVLGAALHAANLSDGIKLNRRLGMIDGSSYGLIMELDGPDLVKDDIDLLLVPRMKKLPSKMFRSIRHNNDFEVSFSYESSGVLPQGISSNKFAQFAVSGLADASTKYSARNLSAPIKANLHFSLSRSGILSFDRAEAVIEISEWVEVPKKNLTSDNSTNATTNITVEASPGNSSDETQESLNIENGANEASSSSAEVQNDAAIVMEKKLKKRTFRVPLKIVEKTVGPGTSLSKEAFSEAKSRLEALDKKDAERKRTAELKNSLEEYIYATRDKLETSDEIAKISTEDERRSFVEKLEEVQEWLYTDGEDAPASKFEERLNMLKAIGDPLFFRLSELSARPLAYEHAQTYLAELPKIVSSWEANKSWIPKSKIDEVLSETDKVKKWLEEKETLQKKNPAFSTPVFTSEEIYDKVFQLQDKVSTINRIPKPKPKIEKPPKEEPKGGGESKDPSNTSEEVPPKTDQATEDPGSPTSEESDPHDEL